MYKRGLWIYAAAIIAASLADGGAAKTRATSPALAAPPTSQPPAWRSRAAFSGRPFSAAARRSPLYDLAFAADLSFLSAPAAASIRSAHPGQKPRSAQRARMHSTRAIDFSLAANHAWVAEPRNEPPKTRAERTDGGQSKVYVDASAGADPKTGGATNLFNHGNGLRGFMAQNWVTPGFGLQGGVAIEDKRLRNRTTELPDNFAIGMGVLLAF